MTGVPRAEPTRAGALAETPPACPRRLSLLICSMGYAPEAYGGRERQAQLQAEELARRGHYVEVVCPRGHGVRSEMVNGVMVSRLPHTPRRGMSTLTFLLSLVPFLVRRVRGIDAVIVHQGYYHADIAVAAARAARRPSWVVLAGPGPEGEIARMRRTAAITRYYGLRHATRVQVISGELFREAQTIGVSAERILKIPNGIHLPSWRRTSPYERIVARRELGFDDQTPTVLFVGRLAHRKGIPELLQAWQHVGVKNRRLVLVGSLAVPDSVGSIQAGPAVSIREPTPDPGLYYRAADALVLPSRSEGMSNVILEAMASGIPVIATRVGAAADVITSGYDGLLVSPGSTAELAAAMTTLLADPSLGAAMGAAAWQTIRDRFSIEKIVDSLLVELATVMDALPRTVSTRETPDATR